MQISLLTELFLCVTTNLVWVYGFGLPLTVNAERIGVKRLLCCLLLMLFCTFSAASAFFIEPHVYSLPDILRPLIYLTCNALLYGLLMGATCLMPKRVRAAIRTALHAVVCSCVGMGVALFTSEQAGTLSNAIHFGLRSGIGVFLVGWMLQAAAPKLNSEKCPSATRGWPAMLIFVGILSCAVLCMTQTNG